MVYGLDVPLFAVEVGEFQISRDISVGKLFAIIADSRVILRIQLDRGLVTALARVNQEFLPLLSVPHRIMQSRKTKGVINDMGPSMRINRQSIKGTAFTVYDRCVPTSFVPPSKCISQFVPSTVGISNVEVTIPIEGQRAKHRTITSNFVDSLDLPLLRGSGQWRSKEE